MEPLGTPRVTSHPTSLIPRLCFRVVLLLSKRTLLLFLLFALLLGAVLPLAYFACKRSLLPCSRDDPQVTVAEAPTALPPISERACPTAPPLQSHSSSSIENQTMLLLDAWSVAFSLNSSQPPASYPPLPPSLPRAPHLEDCLAVTRLRERLERRGPEGQPPPWLKGKQCAGCPPQPPWIRGSDASNLALTRVAQAAIWAHQFPASCRGKRLLITDWPPVFNGLGSQMHVMSGILSLALQHDWVMVPTATFVRANHPECQALGRAASFSCYFAPLASPDCEALAAEALEANRTVLADSHGAFTALVANSSVRFLHVKMGSWLLLMEADAWRLFGAPHLLRPSTIEHSGKLVEEQSELSWWRAQSSRFFLRWPSAYLCHLTNCERQEAFGPLVARQLASSLATQASLLADMRSGWERCYTKSLDGEREAEAFARLDFLSGPSLQTLEERWGREFTSCREEWEQQPAAAAAAGGAPEAASAAAAANAPAGGPSTEPGGASAFDEGQVRYRSVPGGGGSDWSAAQAVREPYVPRPISSLHVRLGDKGAEMKLMSLDGHMLLLHQLRLREPALRNVWLSTEMEYVVESVPRYTDWAFFFSRMPRQRDDHAMWAHEADAHGGFAVTIGKSFANLLIAAQCDFFVGALQSNWPRLINELRQTNGRLYAGYISVSENADLR